MRGTVIICGLILTCAIAATVLMGIRSREARAAAPVRPDLHQSR